LNFTQFVSTGMLGDVNGEQVDMLDKVVHSGKHLLSLINDVLDISKIESGALKLFVETNVDLAKECQSVSDTARTLLNGKSVALSVEIAADLPLITGDKRRIRQIMLNLVSNACKFTETGSIRIALEQQRDNLQFSVSDSGPGIAPEDAELVFEVFRQTETGLRQGEGTGLGLPISQRLAEAHGGKLWFESTPGQGSTFYLSLPVNSPKLQASLNMLEGVRNVA
jgi:signal transduction histidine kinase